MNKSTIKKRRGNSRFFAIFFIALLTLCGLYYGLIELLKQADIFDVKTIEIVGNQNLTKEFLLKVVSDYQNRNLFSFSKREIRNEYENIVRIKQIKVTKILPNKLRIRVLERKGIFYIKTLDGKFIPIDREKMLLDYRNFYYAEDLPVISWNVYSSQLHVGRKVASPYIDYIFNLYENISEFDRSFIDNISEIYKKENQVYIVDNEVGCRILLGEGDLKRKLYRYKFLKNNQGIEKNAVVDLRFANQVITRKGE